MALILDTHAISARASADAVMSFFDANEVPQRVGFAAEEPLPHRLGLTHFGSGVHFMRNEGSGLVIDRTERHVRQHAPTQVALFVSRTGHGTITRGGRCVSYAHDKLMAMDTMSPYSLRQSARADHLVLIVSDFPTSLAPGELSHACDTIESSPLYRLVDSHFRGIATAALEPLDPVAASIGRATTQLVYAALLTTHGNPRRRETLHNTLFLRMADYAGRHLHDPELTPARIAEAHFISLRQLYKVWDRETGQSPHRWIMSRRLERAAELLAGQARSVLPISWVARQCGFTNISHFSRRFRETQGMSPREWSLLNHQG